MSDQSETTLFPFRAKVGAYSSVVGRSVHLIAEDGRCMGQIAYICHDDALRGKEIQTRLSEIIANAVNGVAPAPEAATGRHLGYLRVMEVFDKNETAGSFLHEDGEGGLASGVQRMADEIARLTAERDTALAQVAALDRVRAVERERIAQMIDNNADVLPCYEDASVMRSCATLIRANGSYDDAETIDALPITPRPDREGK